MAHTEEKTPHIFEAMAEIARHVANVGIEKAKQTTGGQRYHYRGIDDVTGVLSSPFAKNSVLVIPRYLGKQTTERPTNSGHWYITEVTVEFTCKSMVDGSEIVLGPCYGQAGDSGDKDLSKAGSVALRNILLQTFLAPVGPEQDPEFSEAPVGDGENPPRQDGPEPARPKAKKNAPAKPETVRGEVVEPLKDAQLRILTASLDRNRVAREDLDAAFPQGINAGNFNDALSWVKSARK